MPLLPPPLDPPPPLAPPPLEPAPPLAPPLVPPVPPELLPLGLVTPPGVVVTPFVPLGPVVPVLLLSLPDPLVVPGVVVPGVVGLPVLLLLLLVQLAWFAAAPEQSAPLSVGVVVVCAAAGKLQAATMSATAAEPASPLRAVLSMVIENSFGIVQLVKGQPGLVAGVPGRGKESGSLPLYAEQMGPAAVRIRRDELLRRIEMSKATTTTDHKVIQKWAEARNGKPSKVKDAAGSGGILRIDFDAREPGLEPISWDEFFKVFDQRKLAFLYQDERDSRFNKFVDRDAA